MYSCLDLFAQPYMHFHSQKVRWNSLRVISGGLSWWKAYWTRLGCLPYRVHSSGSFLIHSPACLFVCIKVLSAVAFDFTAKKYKRSIYTRNLDLLANNCFVLWQFSNSAFYCSHVTCEPFELRVFDMSHIFQGKVFIQTQLCEWISSLSLYGLHAWQERPCLLTNHFSFLFLEKELSPTRHTPCQANNTTQKARKWLKQESHFNHFPSAVTLSIKAVQHFCLCNLDGWCFIQIAVEYASVFSVLKLNFNWK